MKTTSEAYDVEQERILESIESLKEELLAHAQRFNGRSFLALQELRGAGELVGVALKIAKGSES